MTWSAPLAGGDSRLYKAISWSVIHGLWLIGFYGSCVMCHLFCIITYLMPIFPEACFNVKAIFPRVGIHAVRKIACISTQLILFCSVVKVTWNTVCIALLWLLGYNGQKTYTTKTVSLYWNGHQVNYAAYLIFLPEVHLQCNFCHISL